MAARGGVAAGGLRMVPAPACRRLRRVEAHLAPSGGARPSTEPCSTQGPALPSAAQALGVTPTAELGQALGQLQQHGFCILSGVIDPTTTAHLRERAIAAAMAHDTGQSEATWHVSSALTYEQSFAEQIAHPRVLEVLASAMAVAPRELRVSYTTLQVNKPRCLETTPRWHSKCSRSLCVFFHWKPQEVAELGLPDDGYLCQPERYPGPGELTRPLHINTLWMLSDFTRQNGGTLIVPASHARAAAESPQLWEGEGAARQRTDAVHVVAPAGSVCILDCRVWHCLPPNFTEECRVHFITDQIHFCLITLSVNS